MAPPTKSSTSAIKGVNPAPDFTLAMNRIQTQFEARTKLLRNALPKPRPDSQIQTNSSSTTKSFSALSANTPSSTTQPQSRSSSTTAEAHRRAQEAEFAEDRNLDPNAGLGLFPRVSAAESGRNGETAKLRRRLLGKRGRAGDDTGQYKRARKEESSEDEEAGRSGLGRAKRNTNGRKRARAEVSNRDEEQKGDDNSVKSVAPPEVTMTSAEETADHGDADDSLAGGLDTPPSKPPGDAESNATTTEEKPKRKRKKKKKKPKTKTDGD
ncbi:uncharacterized protein F4822DRAFT_241875 [Hypoxylon trugodes]|uniref:uncharacterized protein n=1 Tax=Hypoxylon trugodes TaxID=326681 RepID=UPI00218F8A5E|nr:uncharacterized protein F4822DRAFT_241875 [Hypoxylon trugodes]KAI1388312.1 hypothetical protein F4822DRAFT_241875 [Hypoxylon trugodes]